MKRFLSILLICLLLAACAPAAFASSPQTSAALDAAFATGSLRITQKQLTTLSYADVIWFSSSPDGSRLLGLTPDGSLCIGQPGSGQIQMVTVNAAASVTDEYNNLKSLLSRMNNLAGSDDFATWSPDGRYVAIKSWKMTMQMAQFFMDLFVIDTQSASLLHLASWPGNIRDSGSGAVIQTCFSADSSKLYYTLYTSSAAYRCLTMSYDLATGENVILFDSGWEADGTPFYCDLHDLGLTPAGNFVQIAETLSYGYQGLSVTSPDGQRNFHTLSHQGDQALAYLPRRLQVSSESGYALLTLQGGNSQSYAISVFRPDEDLTGAEKLLIIDPANTLAASLMPRDQLFNSDGSLTPTGAEYLVLSADGKSYSFSPDRALGILDAELSPDGRYALLLTCRTDSADSTASLYLMYLDTLQLMPVSIDNHSISGEFRLLSGSMARFQSGILWNSDNLLILSTTSGTEVCEFVLPEVFDMPTAAPQTQVPASQVPAETTKPSAAASGESFLGAWRHPEDGSTLFLLEGGIAVNQLGDNVNAYPLRWSADGNQLSLWHVGAEDAPSAAELADGVLLLGGAAYTSAADGEASLTASEPYAMHWVKQSGNQAVYLNLNENLTGAIAYSYLDLITNSRPVSYTIESGLITLRMEENPENLIQLQYNSSLDQLGSSSEEWNGFIRWSVAQDALDAEHSAPYLGAWRHPEDGSTLFIMDNGTAVNQLGDNVNAYPLRWKMSGEHLALWHIGEEDQPAIIELVDGQLSLGGALYTHLSASERSPLISEKYSARWEKSDGDRTMYIILNKDLTGIAGYSYLGLASNEREIAYSVENGLLTVRLVNDPEQPITLQYNADADQLLSDIGQWNDLSRRSGTQQAALDAELAAPYVGIWQASVQNADSTVTNQTLHLLNDGLALLISEGGSEEIQQFAWSVRGTTLALGDGSLIPENGQLHLAGRLDGSKRPIFFDKVDGLNDLFTGTYHTFYPSSSTVWCYQTLHILPGGIVVADFRNPLNGAQDIAMTTWVMDGASISIEGKLLTPSGGSLINESGIAYDDSATTFEPLPTEADFIGQWKINEAVITVTSDGTGSIVSDSDARNLTWTIEKGTIILQPEGGIPAIHAFLLNDTLTAAEGGALYHARKIG